MKGVYPLFSFGEEGEEGGSSNCLVMEEEDHLDHFSVYLNGSLSATWKANRETKRSCVTAVGQLIHQGTVVCEGTLVLTEHELTILTETFSVRTYSCMTTDGRLQSLAMEGVTYSLISTTDITEDPERPVEEVMLAYKLDG